MMINPLLTDCCLKHLTIITSRKDKKVFNYLRYLCHWMKGEWVDAHIKPYFLLFHFQIYIQPIHKLYELVDVH